MNKKAQVTIFVIVAILIVMAVVFVLMLYNSPLRLLQTQSQEPNQEIENCIQKSIERASNTLIENGGYIKPVITQAIGYSLGERDEIPYRNYTFLCYTPKSRLHCVPLSPIFLEHIRNELESYLEPEIKECFIVAEHDLESQGYNIIQGNNMNFSVELVPRKIIVEVDKRFEISKAEESNRFIHFTSRATSPMYDFSEIIQEIISQEAEFCNSEYIELMRIYRDFEIEKFQTGNDIKLYSIKDNISEKIFRFLIRGCVIPTPS